MKHQLEVILSRLKKPSVVLSIVSQAASLLLLSGINTNENFLMPFAVAGCSILVALGIISNPDNGKKGYTDQILPCSAEGRNSVHTIINGQWVCAKCGAVYTPLVYSVSIKF